jgi:hypothetical protein
LLAQWVTSMPDIELSTHAKDMLIERNLTEEWVWRTIRTPDRKRRNPEDGNMHHTKAILETHGRILRVVVDEGFQPNRIVTVFFDRRLRKT